MEIVGHTAVGETYKLNVTTWSYAGLTEYNLITRSELAPTSIWAELIRTSHCDLGRNRV